MKNLLKTSGIFLLLMLMANQLNAQNKNEYLLLKGNFGSLPVTMHLYKTDNQYTGYYYFEKTQRPVGISGIDSPRTGKITLYTFYKGKKEVLVLDRIDKKISGTIEVEGSGKFQPVNLRPANAPQKMMFVINEDSVKLLDLPSGYPVCKVKMYTLWPDIKSNEFDWLKDNIREMITGVNYFKEEMPQFLEELKERELTKYKNDYLNVSEKELKESPRTFSVDIEKSLQVIYHTHRLISFALRDYNYSGGAHGNTQYQFLTVDKESKKKIQLNNLFNRTALEDLLPLLEKYYLIEKGLKPGMSLKDAGLFENKISKNPSSCYVTDKGVGFLYNAYTIAPYSTGMIHIFVPYIELTPLINKSFAKSMNWL